MEEYCQKNTTMQAWDRLLISSAFCETLYNLDLGGVSGLAEVQLSLLDAEDFLEERGGWLE